MPRGRTPQALEVIVEEVGEPCTCEDDAQAWLGSLAWLDDAVGSDVRLSTYKGVEIFEGERGIFISAFDSPVYFLDIAEAQVFIDALEVVGPLPPSAEVSRS